MSPHPTVAGMNLEDQLSRYFGTTDLAALTPDVLAAGLEHMRVDFGLEQDSGRRFALWSLMYMLGDAPDVEVAFNDPDEREAARNFMDIAGAADAAD
jgi:hypothetical protein